MSLVLDCPLDREVYVIMIITSRSLSILEGISRAIDDKTFHHHYHILYDIPVSRQAPVYVEIGCYAGGSAILMLQRQKMRVISIDLGTPIPEPVVVKNVEALNVKKNEFHYIRGNSHSPDTLAKLRGLTDSVDILFIDGDHTINGVIEDFAMYQELVVPGGYIVFDDYRDTIHSPEVKVAVDYLVPTLHGYEIIGTVGNQFNARPESLRDGNCFVIRKCL